MRGVWVWIPGWACPCVRAQSRECPGPVVSMRATSVNDLKQHFVLALAPCLWAENFLELLLPLPVWILLTGDSRKCVRGPGRAGGDEPLSPPWVSGGSMQGAKDRGACALHALTIRWDLIFQWEQRGFWAHELAATCPSSHLGGPVPSLELQLRWSDFWADSSHSASLWEDGVASSSEWASSGGTSSWPGHLSLSSNHLQTPLTWALRKPGHQLLPYLWRQTCDSEVKKIKGPLLIWLCGNIQPILSWTWIKKCGKITAE